MFKRPTVGFCIPIIFSVYKVPSKANCSRCCGLQSTFKPTSTTNPVPPPTFGIIVEIVGRKIPSSGFKKNMEPTSIAPVLPELKKASTLPDANNSKPLAMEESGFSFNALVGCS